MPEHVGPPGDSIGPVHVLHEKDVDVSPHATATHTEHVVSYLVAGAIELDHGPRFRMTAGDVVLVPAGVPHRALGGTGLEYWSVAFCSACLGLDETKRLMHPFQRVRRGALPTVAVPPSRRRRVVRLFEDLDEETRRRAPESVELSRSLLLVLLGEVLRALPGHSDAPKHSLVADALSFIQQRCLDPISLRDVAAAVHRSPTHVANTIKRSTGHSVGEWITAGRVAEAAARLAHTDEPLDAIAQAVGWSDKTHFIRQFRRRYGETPAAWRRKHRHLLG